MSRAIRGLLLALTLAAAASPRADEPTPQPIDGEFLIESGTSVPPGLERRVREAIGDEPWQQARAVVVQFVDCRSPRCGESLAALEQFVHAPLAGQHVVVAAFAVDATPEAAEALRTDRALGFPVIADPGASLFSTIAGDGVPRTLIFDGEGRLVHSRAGWQPGREAEFRAVAEAVLAGQPIPRAALVRRRPLAGGGSAAEELYALDIRGKQAPDVPIEEWITPESTAPAEGTFLLVDFWATWCGPCISALELAEKEHHRFADRLRSIAISDEPPARVRAFVNKRGWTQPIATDTQARAKSALDVQGIPHAFLADPTGKVVWQGHPVELWAGGAALLEELLGATPAAAE